MKPARKSNIIKFLEAYNRFFTEQETQDYKNVEILFLTKDESERRIIAGKKESIIVGILITVALPKLLLFFIEGFMTFVFILSTLLLSLVIVTFEITRINDNQINFQVFDGVALQKLYLLYTRGHALTAKMNKNFEMKISLRAQLEYDHCSYFGFYEQPTINIYAASNENTNYISRSSKQLKLVGDQLPHNPFMFEADTCQVRILNYFWIIGILKLFYMPKRF